MSNAGFNAQMATSDGIVPERDLILGFTRAGLNAPGMVALSKVAPGGTTLAQADLAGPWRVYLQRVESKLAGGTWQLGVSTFGPTGAFTGATLEDVTGAVTTLSTGSLVVAANGSVTGTLANGTAATAHRYEITGTMRALKDLITGVLTARLGPTVVYQGLVTMVREATLLDLGQASYSIVEGQPARVTVRRTGNQAGTITVDYSASGGTAPAGDYAVVGSGTLTFPPGMSSRTFDVATTSDGVVQGSR
jgi:Calx-beta domain